MARDLRLALLVGALLTAATACSSEVRFVEVQETQVRIGVPTLDQTITITCIPSFADDSQTGSQVYQGKASGQVITIPRFGQDGRDRLYDRFRLMGTNGIPLGSGRYADRIQDSPGSNASPEWPKTIKGLQDIRDFDDAEYLGVSHTTLNLPITYLLERVTNPAASDFDNEFHHVVDGRVYRFDQERINLLDRKLRSAAQRGINVVAIILCTTRRNSNTPEPLLHPLADGHSPHGIVAANTSDAESERRYRAALGYLGKRYTREDGKYGRIGGYILGNEVQSHWYWHNIGNQSPETVIRQYAEQVRLSYYALKEHVKNPRVFISLDHHWMAMHGSDPQKAIPGRRFLDAFAKDIRERGDIPWHVAWHPYPENLFKPAFWHDRQAWYAFDTPKITFKNVELLPAYLDRSSLHYQGKPRRVILSEQGFHAGNDEKGETLQAAAYAASFVRIRATPGIDAYILHRHVDHPREGGLKVGVRSFSADELGPTRKMHSVFRDAETKNQDASFRFALPLVGIDAWSSMHPHQGPFPERLDPVSNTPLR